MRYAVELPEALRLRRRLRAKYGLRALGMMSALMNKGNCNLMGYSRQFQPGGESFGEKYLFAGPLSVRRKVMEENDFACGENPLIYVSLGTIFNQDKRLLEEILCQLGARKEYQVVMVWKPEAESQRCKLPDNFTVRSFLNQSEILSRAVLFISSGGMNSIHQALYYGVPCLMRPQQGEQLVNAKQFEKMGFGIILRKPEKLFDEARRAIKLKDSWDEGMRHQVLEIHMDDVLKRFGHG